MAVLAGWVPAQGVMGLWDECADISLRFPGLQGLLMYSTVRHWYKAGGLKLDARVFSCFMRLITLAATRLAAL